MEIRSLGFGFQLYNQSKIPLVVKFKGGIGYTISCNADIGDPAVAEAGAQIVVSVSNVVLKNLTFSKNALTILDREILNNFSEWKRKGDSNGWMYNHPGSQRSVTIKLDAGYIDRYDAIHSELLGITIYRGLDKLDRPALNTPEDFLIQTLGLDGEDDDDEEIYWEEGMIKCPKTGLHYVSFVNDPGHEDEPFFTNVSGKAYRVPVLREHGMHPGYYVGVSESSKPCHIRFGIDNINELDLQYYTFGMLKEKGVLESLGLFRSMKACEENGNLEKIQGLEVKIKDLNKDLSKVQEQLKTTKDLLSKSEETIKHNAEEMLHMKRKFENENEHLKRRLADEKENNKNLSRVNAESQKIRELTTKFHTDQLKSKTELNYWGEFAKMFSVFAGVCSTLYRLL